MFKFIILLPLLITPNVILADGGLEYQPIRPDYRPNGGTNVGQIVPLGQPWPASAAGYTQVPPQDNNQPTTLANRFQDVSTTTTSPSSTTTPSNPNLEYNANRPEYHPNAGNNVAQIVPPGKPWPASVDGYTQLNPIENRFQAVAANSTTPPSRVIDIGYKPTRPWYAGGWPVPPLTNKPPVISLEDRFNGESTTVVPVNLEYKPSRPPFAGGFPASKDTPPSNDNASLWGLLIPIGPNGYPLVAESDVQRHKQDVNVSDPEAFFLEHGTTQ